MPTRLVRLLENLRVLMRGRRRDDAELSDEMRAYLDAATDAKVAAGMSRADAERAARVEIGSMPAIRDYVGDAGWATWLDGLRVDTRHAARRLLATPAFAAAVILTLGLGVGLNTAVFSVADAALFKPLPYKNPQQLVTFVYVVQRGTAEEAREIGVTWDQLDGWRQQTQIFAGIETFRSPQAAALEGAGSSDATSVARISPGLVGLLGLSPIVGRGFGPDDAVADTRVALLGEAYWKRAFRGDRGVVGRTVTVDGRPYKVVGVLPASLSWWVDGRKVAAWLPLDERDERRRDPPFADAIARLSPRLTFEDARREIRLAAPAIANAAPLKAGNGGSLRLDDVEPMAIDERNDATNRAILVAVLGAATLVLLIACANVANLFLTRHLSRRREIALRMAIGASRGRIARQLLTEGALLIALGGVAGWTFAAGAVTVFPRLLPDDLRLLEANPLALDTRSMLVCVAATALTGLLCCVAPALRGSRQETLEIGDGGPRTGGRPHRTRAMSQVLQATQVALTLVLLAGTSVLTSSLVKMVRSDAGYDVDGLVTLTLSIDSRELRAGSEASFFSDVLARIRQIPGIRAAYGNPPTGSYSGRLVAEGTENAPAPAGAPGLDVFWIDGDYLTVTGMSLTAGRAFNAGDIKGSPDVALVDERAAAQQWPGKDPIGQRVRMSPYMPWATVVGVVRPIKTKWFASPGGTIQAYFPLDQAPEMNRGRRPLVVRSSGEWRRTIESVRAATRNIRPALRISEAAAVSDLYGPAFVTPRFSLLVMTLFTLLALVTASVGLYGTLNDVVGQRRNEIGIRMALGARASQVCQLVVRESLAAVGAGLLVGLAAFSWFSRALAGLLFETAPLDPGPFGMAILTLIIVAAAAAYRPVRQATRIDPVVALRAE